MPGAVPHAVRRAAALVTGALVLGLVGCTPDPAPDPSPETTGTATSGTPTHSPTEPASVTRTATVARHTFTVTAHPVQAGPGWALLTLDWTNSASAESLFWVNDMFTGTPKDYLTYPRLVDLTASWVSWVGADTEGNPVSTRAALMVDPGETVSSEIFFATPPGESVDVLLPYLGLLEDVPVVPAASDTTTPADLGIAWQGELPSATVGAFTAAYDASVGVGVAEDEATVTLASDVLFATDEHELTRDATAVVDKAATAILETADGGQVAVVGHTDDRASGDYNQALSERRAGAVADRLGERLGAGFTVTAEGRGETEPAAEGTSAQARAANRRVEIRFVLESSGGQVGLGGGTLPPATGATAAGHESFEVERDGKTYQLAVSRVARRGGHLVGTIEVTGTPGDRGVRGLFLPPETFGPAWTRGFGTYALFSVASIALAGDGVWVYPSEYALPEGGDIERSVVGDQVMNQAFATDGTPAVVTVVWPDTGQSSVTVDVDGLWRVTDVPVED